MRHFSIISILCLLLVMVLAAFIAVASIVRVEVKITGHITFEKWASLRLEVESARRGIWMQQKHVEAWRDGRGKLRLELALFRDAESVRHVEDRSFHELSHTDLALQSVEGHQVSVFSDEPFDLHLFPQSGDMIQIYGFSGDVREIGWITDSEIQAAMVTSDGTPVDVVVDTYVDTAADTVEYGGYLVGSKLRSDDAFIHYSGVHIDHLREHGLVATVEIESTPSDNPQRLTGLDFGWDLEQLGGNTSIYTSLYATSLYTEAPVALNGSVRADSSIFEVMPGDDVSLSFEDRGRVTLEDGSLSFSGESKDVRVGGDLLAGSHWDAIPQAVQAAIWIAIGALLAPAARSFAPIVGRWRNRDRAS